MAAKTKIRIRFINKGKILTHNEKKFKTMEEERANALEVAA